MKKKEFSKKFILLILLIVVLVIVIALILWKYGAWKFLSIRYLRKFTGRIRNLGLLGLIIYLLSFAVGTMLCLPSLPFALLGGLTYGTVLGIIYACIGDLLGATLAFILARYVLKERIERRFKENKAFKEIDEGVKKDGWRIIVLTRMVPIIPHWLQNYAYGITSISFITYVFVTLLCIIPGTAAWIFVINRAGLGEGDAKRTILYFSIASVIIVAISYLPKWIYKRKRRRGK